MLKQVNWQIKKSSVKFELELEKPLIVFIGRLVGEKAADLLPQVIGRSFLLYWKENEFPGSWEVVNQMWKDSLEVMKNVSCG